MRAIILLQKKSNKIALISNDNKRIESINWIETDAYGMNKDLVCMKE